MVFKQLHVRHKRALLFNVLNKETMSTYSLALIGSLGVFSPTGTFNILNFFHSNAYFDEHWQLLITLLIDRFIKTE